VSIIDIKKRQNRDRQNMNARLQNNAEERRIRRPMPLVAVNIALQRFRDETVASLPLWTHYTPS
jgi:hypothetical protein